MLQCRESSKTEQGSENGEDMVGFGKEAGQYAAENLANAAPTLGREIGKDAAKELAAAITCAAPVLGKELGKELGRGAAEALARGCDVCMKCLTVITVCITLMMYMYCKYIISPGL